MRQTLLIAIGASSLLLAGCGETAPAGEPAQAAATPAEPRMAQGSGTVTALDAGAGTVTIDHGPMPDIGWSAMTMTFDIDPTLLVGIAKGDSVTFGLTVTDNRGEVTAITAP